MLHGPISQTCPSSVAGSGVAAMCALRRNFPSSCSPADHADRSPRRKGSFCTRSSRTVLRSTNRNTMLRRSAGVSGSRASWALMCVSMFRSCHGIRISTLPATKARPGPKAENALPPSWRNSRRPRRPRDRQGAPGGMEIAVSPAVPLIERNEEVAQEGDEGRGGEQLHGGSLRFSARSPCKQAPADPALPRPTADGAGHAGDEDRCVG